MSKKEPIKLSELNGYKGHEFNDQSHRTIPGARDASKVTTEIPEATDTKNHTTGRVRPSRLVRLARLIGTSIDWRQAERVDDIFPGFLDAYVRMQDEWEENPNNRRSCIDGLIIQHEKSKRLSRNNSKVSNDAKRRCDH